MKLCSLTSGSSGNSIYIEGERAKILVDCGASEKYISSNIPIDIKELDAIFITHEHIDHINGLGVMMRKHNIPVFLTEDTLKAILDSNKIGKVDTNYFNIIRVDRAFSIGNTEILPFSISHDAVDPVGFRFKSNNTNIAIATDLGMFDDYIIDNLKGLNCIMLEANHDVRMLECGPYSYSLKKRIQSIYGHLSNDDASYLLSKVISDKTKDIVLGHLSSENNYHEIAHMTVRNFLKHNRDDIDINEINIDVAMKRIRGRCIEVG